MRIRRRDILFFIDNIFRFTQAGSEVSALLGRMPSAVGYQPTLATEMGLMQERITSTKSRGSITSVQAVYVPADDLTDPAPATTFAHLDATTVLSRKIAELGYLPCCGSTRLYFANPGSAHHRRFALQYCSARKKYPYSATTNFWTSSPSLVWRNCQKRTNLWYTAHVVCNGSLSQPFHVAEQFTGLKGVLVPIEETIRGFNMIMDGEPCGTMRLRGWSIIKAPMHVEIVTPEYPEAAFNLVGTIDDAIEKGKVKFWRVVLILHPWRLSLLKR
jgi:F-type H+-transporting ATPase subunit beta